MKISEEDFFNLVCKQGFYSKPERLRYFLSNQLFAGVDLSGKRILDIGGGNGLFGFFALLRGASEVVIMEPEFDGCTNGMIDQFYELHNLLGGHSRITLVKETIQEYKSYGSTFDIILMTNSINHFDEAACVDLHINSSSKEVYRKIFGMIHQLCKEHSNIIMTDCTNKNFFPQIGWINPLMPSIEWEKHQPPEVWASFMIEKGFCLKSIRWSSPNCLGWLGRLLLGNKFANYFTMGHFRLEMCRNKSL